jgi:hypothetical protein
MTANLSGEFFAHLSHRYQTATPCQGPWRLEHEAGDDGVTIRVVADGATLFEVVVPIDGSDRAIDAAHDIGLAIAARNAGLLLMDEVLRLQKELAEAVAARNDLLHSSGGTG